MHGPGPGGLLDWNPVVAGDVKSLLLRDVQTAIGGAFALVGGVSQANLALVGPTNGTTVDVPTVRTEAGVALGPVAPNPVHTMARVRFTLARPARVSLTLFDLAGRRAVTILDRAPFVAGDHEAAISSAGLEPGVYFLRLETGLETATRKIAMVR